jgi:oligopeptidase B
MISRRELLAGTAAFALLGARPLAKSAKSLPFNPPQTPRVPVRIEQLGRVRVDDFAWLKPSNWQEVWRDPSLLDPKILDYLKVENRYCDAVLEPTEMLQRALIREMKQHVSAAAASRAVPDGSWAYYTLLGDGAQHPTYARRALAGGSQEVLLDVEQRASSKPYLAVRNAVHSPDHQLFAWAEDTAGAEKFVIRVKDLASGEIVTGPSDAFGDFAFSADSKYLFWIWRDPNSRPRRLYRRRARGGPDTLIYEEKDPGFLLEVVPSASGDWLFVRSFNDVTGEIRIIDAHRPEAGCVLVAPRLPGVDYAIEHWRDRFVMRTNSDGAEDFKLMWAPVHSPTGPWRPWVPHRPGRAITQLHPRADEFAWLERVEGNLHILACGLDGVPRQSTKFSEAAYVLAVQPSPYADDALWITLESPRLPPRWIRCDLATGAQQLLQPAPISRHEKYVLKRLHARAADGAMVPVTVLHASTTSIDGSAPLLLTGYGSYGYSYETNYSAPVLALVDRGWVWAVAHVRGGSEKGRAWFEQARQLKKKTSFTDFISCAEMLITTRHSRAKRIAIHGYSAGGLLVGAAANLRPDLWSAVVGQAPFVDMLNTMSDASHPLVPLTRPVWGDPLSSPAAYDYIASYSPYDNVERQPYPASLATTAIGDDRVGFWEPAKWIAALRRHSTSAKPMLLHTELAGGHLGASGRFDELEQFARMYAFAIWQTTGAVK